MERVGQFTQVIIDALHLPIVAGTPIMLGENNVEHMKRRHPADYDHYGCDIKAILSTPDYVGKNPKDGSIEFVKEYHIDNEYVKVAVRISLKGTYFARSLYVLNSSRVENFIKRGTLIKVSD